VQKYKLFNNPKHFKTIYFEFCQDFKAGRTNMEILQPVYDWYFLNKRDLPWRQTTDPYKIWVSEIILQQTRVAQGVGYYTRFTAKFPDIEALAAATEEEVLKQWQGLGYYSRARNMHKTAQKIADQFSGKFPEDYKDILGLSGIGEYTAAAIASIAYGQPYAAVDGNVIRIISRYFEVGLPGTKNVLKTCKKIANEILDLKNPGEHNQALMDFGATVCLPSNPQCHSCPVAGSCLAYNHNTVRLLPPKKNPTILKARYFYYFVVEEGDSLYLQKRTAKDIWKNLYEPLLIEKNEDMNPIELLETTEFKTLFNDSAIEFLRNDGPYTHILSHQKIIARFIHMARQPGAGLNGSMSKVHLKDIHKFAVSRLVEKYFIKTGIL
jgi:A/G-specific adenine glycosylase